MEGQGFARRRTYLLATTRRQGPCCACPISASYCQKDQEQGENRQQGLHLSRSSPVGTEKSGAAARSVHQHPQGSQDSNGHSYTPSCLQHLATTSCPANTHSTGITMGQEKARDRQHTRNTALQGRYHPTTASLPGACSLLPSANTPIPALSGEVLLFSTRAPVAYFVSRELPAFASGVKAEVQANEQRGLAEGSAFS